MAGLEDAAELVVGLDWVREVRFWVLERERVGLES